MSNFSVPNVTATLTYLQQVIFYCKGFLALYPIPKLENNPVLTAYSTYSHILSNSRRHLVCLQPEDATSQLYPSVDE